MDLPESLTLASQLPEKWRPKYILKRIKDEDITISLETRNEVLKQMASGGKFIQIGEYTIMLNAIRSIDPMWGAKNIPPRPAPDKELEYKELENGSYLEQVTVKNQSEINEWNKHFGSAITEAWMNK